MLTFADRDAFVSGDSAARPGKAAAADVPTFATGGASLLSGEVTTYV